MNSVKIVKVDAGNEIPLSQLDGRIYNCYTMTTSQSILSLYTKRSCLLGVTNTQIIQLVANPLRLGIAHVKEVHELEGLAKLRFKRGDEGLIVLEYKSGLVCKYYMQDAGNCAELIKQKMKLIGIKGNTFNSVKTQQVLATAQSYLDRMKELETKFSIHPSFVIIEEIMDLMRKAAEQFDEVNDDKYKTVVLNIKNFLQRSDVIEILDAMANLKMKASSHPTSSSGVHSPLVAERGVVLKVDNGHTGMLSDGVNGDGNGSWSLLKMNSPMKNDPSGLGTPISMRSFSQRDEEEAMASIEKAVKYAIEDEEEMMRNSVTGESSASGQHNELSQLLNCLNEEFSDMMRSFTEDEDDVDQHIGISTSKYNIINEEVIET